MVAALALCEFCAVEAAGFFCYQRPLGFHPNALRAELRPYRAKEKRLE